MGDKNCCTMGAWEGLEWRSECRDWYAEIVTEAPGEFFLTLRGDEWKFEDVFYGTEDEAKAYALDVLHGVSPTDGGISSAVARAKARHTARKR